LNITGNRSNYDTAAIIRRNPRSMRYPGNRQTRYFVR
jgi:hypothetical protein